MRRRIRKRVRAVFSHAALWADGRTITASSPRKNRDWGKSKRANRPNETTTKTIAELGFGFLRIAVRKTLPSTMRGQPTKNGGKPTVGRISRQTLHPNRYPPVFLIGRSIKKNGSNRLAPKKENLQGLFFRTGLEGTANGAKSRRSRQSRRDASRTIKHIKPSTAKTERRNKDRENRSWAREESRCNVPT